VGVFVTASGIVIGADTAQARTLDGKTDFILTEKIAACGSGSYVGLTGTTRWQLLNGVNLVGEEDGIRTARGECAAADSERRSIRARGERVVQALLQRANASYPRSEDSHLDGSVLETFVIAGYEMRRPVVLVAQIVLAQKPRRFVRTEWQDRSANCTLLMGTLGPINALRNGRPPVPAELAQRSEVQAVQTNNCATLSVSQAEAFFRLAVDVSYQYSEAFGKRQGTVNWPVDFGVIRPNGTQSGRRVPKP
jgi:hypothetical protein